MHAIILREINKVKAKAYEENLMKINFDKLWTRIENKCELTSNIREHEGIESIIHSVLLSYIH